MTAKADFKGVSLSIPQWMIKFKDLKGVIDIDDEKITAAALTGKFFGDPVKLSAKPDSKRKRTELHLVGNMHSRNLLTLTPDYLQQPVSGISSWDLSVSLAHRPSAQVALLEISANSNLMGTELDFPRPARLSKAQQKSLTFNALFFQQGDFTFDISLAGDLKVAGDMKLAEGVSDNLQWLNISLGRDNTISNSRKGVTVGGKTDHINLNDWFDYQKLYFPDGGQVSLPFLKKVNSLDLDIDRLFIGNQQALNSKVKILNDGKLLQGSIESKLVKGNFKIPYRMAVVKPFMADLEYIKLKKPESTEKTKIDINDMPNLFIKSKSVSFEAMNFTDFVLSSRSETNKFFVEQLDFSSDDVKLKSSGYWQFEPKSKEHVSVFNIDIKGSDFGKTVNNLGLGESIQGSSVDFNGQIGWGGELYSINWPTLIGEVDLQLEDGYLRNVDPGAGRFVGLLSFNALPKRLFLDFGDVVREGMQFNEIKGKFSIHGEIMETDNASMDSVSAKVKVKGETNLRQQTYDQTMTIIPKIGDTLPLLGAIAAGSTVGWGLLLIQKLFNKPIEKSVEIEYKVTGSWQKPEVNLVEKSGS